ncbi:MAG: hypothetical protein EOM67_04340 [Spirochaetia bacterium]|nr:hypothetical protein [Spirochaetia bacterium]
MKISAKYVALLLIVIILGGVLVLMLSGLWITEGKKVPTKITTGAYSGMANPGDIRGSYTLLDIETNFSIPSETIASAFQLDTSIKDAQAYKAKDIEEMYFNSGLTEGDIGTDSVKYFVSLYLGIPYAPEEDTILPSTAVNLLNSLEKITQHEYAALSEKSYTVNNSSMGTDQNKAIQQSSLTASTYTIKGNTTFFDLIEWGLTQEEIEEVLTFPLLVKSSTIKDVAEKEGIEFSILKNAFQNILNNL